jgi:hypothetical protein
LLICRTYVYLAPGCFILLIIKMTSAASDPLTTLSHLFAYLYPPAPLPRPPTASLPPLLSLLRSLLLTHLACLPANLLMIADQPTLLLEVLCGSLAFSLLLTLHLEVLIGYSLACIILMVRVGTQLGNGVGELDGVYRVFRVAVGVIGVVQACVRYQRYRGEVRAGWRQSWGDRVVQRCRGWREERARRREAREEVEREKQEEYLMMLKYIRRQKKASYMDIEARERLLPSASTPRTPAKSIKKRPPPKNTVKSEGYLSIAESST